MVFLLKWVLVAALLAAGVIFLLNGIGATIPSVTFKGLEAHGVPIGVALLAAGVALAYFWKVSRKVTTTTTTEESPDGVVVKTTTKIIDTTLLPK